MPPARCFCGFFEIVIIPWTKARGIVIFGALHAVTFGYFLLASAMGFYLGWLFEFSGNLLVPMVVHALYDIFALGLLARIYGEERETESRQRP